MFCRLVKSYWGWRPRIRRYGTPDKAETMVLLRYSATKIRRMHLVQPPKRLKTHRQLPGWNDKSHWFGHGWPDCQEDLPVKSVDPLADRRGQNLMSAHPPGRSRDRLDLLLLQNVDQINIAWFENAHLRFGKYDVIWFRAIISFNPNIGRYLYLADLWRRAAWSVQIYATFSIAMTYGSSRSACALL